MQWKGSILFEIKADNLCICILDINESEGVSGVSDWLTASFIHNLQWKKRCRRVLDEQAGEQRSKVWGWNLSLPG